MEMKRFAAFGAAVLIAGAAAAATATATVTSPNGQIAVTVSLYSVIAEIIRLKIGLAGFCMLFSFLLLRGIRYC